MSDAPVMPDLPQLPEQIGEHNQVSSNPQVIQPQIIFVQQVQQPQPLTVFDIYCKCVAPKFDSCKCCVGGCTALFAGCGLCCCISCYGSSKLDKCDVCLAGFVMWLTSSFVVGWVVACIVGCQICYN
ncbi:Cysteine-rich membrane protein 2 [Spironucleus salmonicida]|uniref:Cysteine-rich membrane protein 2 n=1 Tax=Spironucleus salmonicida TaxID=348837 RepID=V6M5E1_9EUKA|nr:Cysteine-rich membrane protein 2 [Spironucleus salmonicida]|eukprot:EST48579.1 Cysteine-rich membrane protein 2 [Spironucleus salmonicida]